MRARAFPPLLGWLPGETLFSLASRSSVLWGTSNPANIGDALFGSSLAGYQHDLPSGLNTFVDRTYGYLGSGAEIALERTLLTYYRRFISEEKENKAVEQMLGHRVNHLKYRMGLLTSRFRANHPLKGCPGCIQEGIVEFGWSYWRLQHQYPGVWVCQKHGTMLQESILKSTGVGRFRWHLPNGETLRVWPKSGESANLKEREPLLKLAQTISFIVETKSLGRLDPTTLLSVYRFALDQRGWVTSSGNLRLKLMAPDYLNYVAKFRFLPEFRSLPESIEIAKIQLGRILRPLLSGTHPLRHLLIIDWLYRDAKSFELALLKAVEGDLSRTNQSNQPRGLGKQDVYDTKRKHTIKRLRLSSQSVRSVAKEVGVDTQTALSWASEEGIKVKKRPKKLDDQSRESILQALRSGIEKSGIAEAFNISIATVNRILRSEPGMRESWQTARHARIGEGHRAAWLNLLKRYQKVGAKLMRAEAPAVYAWLYRNDRVWLQMNKPASLEVLSIRQSYVRWDSRDRNLMRQVQVAAYDLFKSGSDRIYLWQLYQAVPELRAKLSVLDRLPLTLKTINYLLDWRRHDGIPKLQTI